MGRKQGEPGQETKSKVMKKASPAEPGTRSRRSDVESGKCAVAVWLQPDAGKPSAGQSRGCHSRLAITGALRAVASPPGHQFQSPAIRSSAGPITIRTSVASIKTATASVNPIIL